MIFFMPGFFEFAFLLNLVCFQIDDNSITLYHTANRRFLPVVKHPANQVAPRQFGYQPFRSIHQRGWVGQDRAGSYEKELDYSHIWE